MEKFEKLASRVIPLPVKDVDTDLIIPAQFLTSVSREGYGQNLFRRLKDSDPSFPLNLPDYRDAKILVADHNFGCGSSREHAVWAILGAGIRVVIAKSFADIFSGNSAKNGLLLVTLPDEAIDKILSGAATGPYFVEVDLASQQVRTLGGKADATAESECFSFAYDSFRKHCLLEGLDDVDYIVAKATEIKQYRQQREGQRYFSTLSANHIR